MRICTKYHPAILRALAGTAALLAASAAGAQDQTTLQTEATNRAALASIADSNAKIAASNAATTKALVEPLASLAGTGKRELAGDAGKIEVALLGSTALVTLADRIAGDVSGDGKLVVLSDDETLNIAAAWQFDAEAAQITRRFARAMKAAPTVCRSAARVKPAPGILGAPFVGAALAGGPFAVIGAIGSLLQSDVTVTGVAYAPKSRIVAALVASKLGANAISPGSYLSPAKGAVDASLSALDAAEEAAAGAVAKCASIAETKRTPSQTALLADVAATGAALTALRIRLYTPDASGRIPLLDVLVAKSVVGHKILRLRVEDSGGSVIITKNLLTTFGAPALSVTGGIVAGYLVADPMSGRIDRSALYRCQSQARMLHSVHRDGRAAASCVKVEIAPTAT